MADTELPVSFSLFFSLFFSSSTPAAHSALRLRLGIYFYIQMLRIATGKGRPFSQQGELILFECSLSSLKRGEFAMEACGGFVSENLTTFKQTTQRMI